MAGNHEGERKSSVHDGETAVDLEHGRYPGGSNAFGTELGATGSPTNAMEPHERRDTIGSAEDLNQGEQVAEEEEILKKLHVIVRIRPSPNLGANVFDVDSETKTIQIRVDRDDKEDGRAKKHPPGFIYFPADDVLENSSQEDTFITVGEEIVDKAMEGMPGMIVAVGPETSGKSFSLYGLNGRYRNRGIIARTMERMFEIKTSKAGEIEFRFGLGIIEVRRERIRDLITLGPQEINEVGDRGPKMMYVEEIDCLEHGLGLLLRALIGQKLIHQKGFERYHTIVYLQILALSPDTPDLIFFESKLTFAEITSAPSGVVQTPILHCPPPPAPKIETKFKFKQAAFPSRKCCNPASATGPLAESIAVRRDIFALERIFNRANEMERIRQYFAKLESLGLSMIMSEKKRLASGHNFRQSRLAYCLKDILDPKTGIKILLHVRPDKAYLKTSLEAMRFVERARLVPSNQDGVGGQGKSQRSEEQILQEVINDIAPDLMHPAAMENLSVPRMKAIQEQAVQYFDNNIDSMKVCSKDKVKEMFENFRVLWNFLWELELSVSLRKAEEEIRGAMRGQMKSMSKAKSHSEPPPPDVEDEDQQSKDLVTVKKSGKKLKKGKDGKRSKRHKTSADNLESATDVQKPPGQTDENEETHSGRSSHHHHHHHHHHHSHDESAGRAPGDPRTSQDPTGETPSSVPAEQPPPGPSQDRRSVESAKQEAPAQVELDKKSDSSKPPPTPVSPVVRVSLPGSDNMSTATSIQAHPFFSNQPRMPKSPHLHQSSFSFLKEGFTDFQLQSSSLRHNKDMTPEERAEFNAKQEQMLSDSFEEMKKVARRQAVHLIKTGVQRPEWTTLF